MSNFDLVMRVMALRGLKSRCCRTRPRPRATGCRQAASGRRLEVTPLSPSSMRQAVTRLEGGGIVMTGMDRPSSESKSAALFRAPFRGNGGLYSPGAQSEVPVVVLGNQMRPDGVCYVQASEPIQMRPHQDLETEVVQKRKKPSNGRASLSAKPRTVADVLPGLAGSAGTGLNCKLQKRQEPLCPIPPRTNA